MKDDHDLNTLELNNMLGLPQLSTLISVPPKCGWMGLKSCLLRNNWAVNINPQHGREQHTGYDKRVLVVRDPLARSVSMFWYIQQANSKWAHLNDPHLKNFYSFSKFLGTYQGKVTFMFHTIDTFVKEFEPHLIIPQEKIEDRWEEFLLPEYLPFYRKTKKHATRARKTLEQTIKKVHPSFIPWLEKQYDSLGDLYDKKARLAVLRSGRTNRRM